MTHYYVVVDRKWNIQSRVYNLCEFAMKNNINLARLYDTYLHRNDSKCPQWHQGWKIVEQVKFDRNDISPQLDLLYDCIW